MTTNNTATLYVVHGSIDEPTMARREYDLDTMSWDKAVMAARDEARKFDSVISALLTTGEPGKPSLTKVFRVNEYMDLAPIF